MQFLPQLQAGLTAGGPQLLQKGTELLNQLVSGIFAALPNIFQAGYSAIAEFGNSIFANLPQVLEALESRGLLESSAMVQNCGLPGEQAAESLKDAPQSGSYFTTLLVP